MIDRVPDSCLPLFLVCTPNSSKGFPIWWLALHVSWETKKSPFSPLHHTKEGDGIHPLHVSQRPSAVGWKLVPHFNFKWASFPLFYFFSPDVALKSEEMYFQSHLLLLEDLDKLVLCSLYWLGNIQELISADAEIIYIQTYKVGVDLFFKVRPRGIHLYCTLWNIVILCKLILSLDCFLGKWELGSSSPAPYIDVSLFLRIIVCRFVMGLPTKPPCFSRFVATVALAASKSSSSLVKYWRTSFFCLLMKISAPAVNLFFSEIFF